MKCLYFLTIKRYCFKRITLRSYIWKSCTRLFDIVTSFIHCFSHHCHFTTAHIFFDDAFEISDDNEDENVVNQFVRLLVNLMDDAATHVHQTNIRIRPPKKFPAPYGGRLVWTLPGKTKIVAHLKDKGKIRHKKRWSQVILFPFLFIFFIYFILFYFSQANMDIVINTVIDLIYKVI